MDGKKSNTLFFIQLCVFLLLFALLIIRIVIPDGKSATTKDLIRIVNYLGLMVSSLSFFYFLGEKMNRSIFVFIFDFVLAIGEITILVLFGCEILVCTDKFDDIVTLLALLFSVPAGALLKIPGYIYYIKHGEQGE